MHPNAKLIESFYTSFQRLDDKSMAACYHPEVEFSDPVFPILKGQAVPGMWKMLCSRANNFDLNFENFEADAYSGRVHWEAKYKFSNTGRDVHNKIDAEFQFEDGKIIRHSDTFDFWMWSSMALGPVGTLLGWTPILKTKVQRQAASNLENFLDTANS